MFARRNQESCGTGNLKRAMMGEWICHDLFVHKCWQPFSCLSTLIWHQSLFVCDQIWWTIKVIACSKSVFCCFRAHLKWLFLLKCDRLQLLTDQGYSLDPKPRWLMWCSVRQKLGRENGGSQLFVSDTLSYSEFRVSHWKSLSFSVFTSQKLEVDNATLPTVHLGNLGFRVGWRPSDKQLGAPSFPSQFPTHRTPHHIWLACSSESLGVFFVGLINRQLTKIYTFMLWHMWQSCVSDLHTYFQERCPPIATVSECRNIHPYLRNVGSFGTAYINIFKIASSECKFCILENETVNSLCVSPSEFN